MYYEKELEVVDGVQVTGWSVTLYSTVRRFWNPAPWVLGRARWREHTWLVSDGTQNPGESFFRLDVSEWLVLPPLGVFVAAEVCLAVVLVRQIIR
jgi:hypothetical protein